jgi:ferredoxin-NADP reductase
MAQHTNRYILKWSRMITPRVRHLAFMREDENPVPFIAGQFITLHIDDPTKGKVVHRSYSLANSPSEENLFELACAYVEGGVATNLLFNLQPGDAIIAGGPVGLFTLKKDEAPRRYILIATGTGVTPYRSMLGELKHRFSNQTHTEAMVIQGVRTPDELLYGDDFKSFADQHPNFTFTACYSREGKATLEAHERMGRVQDVFSELGLDPAQDIVYLCGNPNMIDEAFATLSSLGFERKNIRREKYLFSH